LPVVREVFDAIFTSSRCLRGRKLFQLSQRLPSTIRRLHGPELRSWPRALTCQDAASECGSSLAQRSFWWAWPSRCVTLTSISGLEGLISRSPEFHLPQQISGAGGPRVAPKSARSSCLAWPCWSCWPVRLSIHRSRGGRCRPGSMTGQGL
jgi:hypothetical protein